MAAVDPTTGRRGGCALPEVTLSSLRPSTGFVHIRLPFNEAAVGNCALALVEAYQQKVTSSPVHTLTGLISGYLGIHRKPPWKEVQPSYLCWRSFLSTAKFMSPDSGKIIEQLMKSASATAEYCDEWLQATYHS